MKLFGENVDLSFLARIINEENIEALKIEIKNGLDLNEKIFITKHINETPLTLAINHNKVKMIMFLIENGASVTLKENPPIPDAADSCDIEIIKLFLKKGADLYAENNLGSNAMDRALMFERYDIIRELIKLGMDIKDNGSILRSATYENKKEMIEILFENNIDVNFHTSDMIFPYNPTAVCIAATADNFDLVKLLVKNGADVTIKDDYGNRP